MTNNTSYLFNNLKQCELCKKPLPRRYQEGLCPTCLDNELFKKVKEFIRENTVNEYQVAEEFNIPLRQVKTWIREGRIEYKKDTSIGIENMRCQRCGIKVSFGSLCPKCLKLLNSPIHIYGQAADPASESKMQYLDKKNDED